MDFNKLCRGCFREMPHEGMQCPYCGFDAKGYEQHRENEVLPLDTILRGLYIVGRVLGKGGFGITYIGWHINLESVVAIKEFYPAGIVARDTSAGTGYESTSIHLTSAGFSETYEKAKEGFLKEARTLGKIHLPGVVDVHDCFEENRTVYLVMDYVRGIDLKKYIRNRGGRIPEAETLHLMKPVIHSLQELHRQQVIHRDISPDNILLNEDGEVTLIDFGAARSVGLHGNNNRSMTVVLKPGYAPIEQYNNRGNQGPWTDIYALCATMYKMMTGITPEDPGIRLERSNDKEAQMAALKNAQVSENTCRALIRGMEIVSGSRFQRMEELERALYHTGKTPVPSGKKEDEGERGQEGSSAEKKKRAGLWIGLAAGVLLLAALVGLLIHSAGENRRKQESAQLAAAQKESEEKAQRESREESEKAAQEASEQESIAASERESQEASEQESIAASERESQEASEQESIAASERESQEASEQESIAASERESQEASEQEAIAASERELQEASEQESIAASERESQEASEQESREESEREAARAAVSCLVTGSEISEAMKRLAGSEANVYGEDTAILAVRVTQTPVPDGAQTADIAMEGWEPVTMWFEDSTGTIWWQTNAQTLQLNEDSEYLFCGLTRAESIDVSRLDTSRVRSFSHMFYQCESVTGLDVSGFDTSFATDMSGMFAFCRNLTALDVSGFDTSHVTDMAYMFVFCDALPQLDVSCFDTSHVTDMGSMFDECSSLTSLDISSFDTRNVTDMSDMFEGMSSVSVLDVSNLDTSSCTDMSGMFGACSLLRQLDLSRFDTAKVKQMSYMFFGCRELESLDLGAFDTGNVTTMSNMFWNCDKLRQINLSGFNTAAVTDFSEMFGKCGALTALDLSSFTVSENANLSQMFDGCDALTELNTDDPALQSQVREDVGLDAGSSEIAREPVPESSSSGQTAPQTPETEAATGNDSAEAQITRQIYQQPVRVVGTDIKGGLMLPKMLNESDETIISPVICFIAWEADGTLHEFQLDSGGTSAVVYCQMEGVTVAAGAMETNWGMEMESGIASYAAVMYSYERPDGTTWTNPVDVMWRVTYLSLDRNERVVFNDRETIRKVQEKLNELGYDCGTADGLMGRKTYTGMNRYQYEQKLTVTEDVLEELLISLGISRD